MERNPVVRIRVELRLTWSGRLAQDRIANGMLRECSGDALGVTIVFGYGSVA
jgi:hypothetical protein